MLRNTSWSGWWADDEGNVWCVADDARTGITSYGNVDAATVEACVGGWDAHPEAAGPD